MNDFYWIHDDRQDRIDDEQRKCDEIDQFLDNLKPDQFGAVATWLASFDESRQATFDRWIGAAFLGIAPMPHEVSKMREWMTDFLSKNDVIYSEILELYA